MTAAKDSQEPIGPDSAISALFDGELDDRELDGLLQSLAQDADALETCASYRVISDVMNRAAPTASALPPHLFLAGVHARLAAEPVPVVIDTVQVQPTRAPAANDTLFRWKLAAGFASFAAVLAISWGLLGNAPGAPGGITAAPQLAQASPAVVGEPVPAAVPVVVNTPQGQVLRDARLEQLLAEHRQYGGMSALQMPAGFLRDATYQPAPQR